jgi:predicted porin
MKKHLIAAAVAGALAVPAMAQVTVYGTLELGIENTSGAAEHTRMDSHEFVSNRLGFRGEEDLGGGMKATFRLETGLNTSEGDAGTTNSFFNRGAEIGLSGGFGSVRLGKLDHAGIEGNDDLLLGNLGLGANEVELGAGTQAFASDVDDTVSYTTPAMGGFTLNLTHTIADNGTAGHTAGGDTFTHNGITSYQLAGKVGALAVKLGGGEAKNTAANGGTTVKVLGGSARYDLGVAAVSAFYQKQDNPDGTADATNYMVSVRAPLGGGLDAGGFYERFDIADTDNGDITTMGLMVQKALSKRTSVYGLYRIADPKAANTDSTKTLGFYVGHSF